MREAETIESREAPKDRRLWPWLVPAGLALYVFFAAWSVNKPFTADEVDYAAAGRAVALTGKPAYYGGECPGWEKYTDPVFHWEAREAPGKGMGWGLWHSPLCVYAVGAVFRVFGFHNWSGRLLGVFCSLGTLWLLRGIARQFYPREEASRVFGIVAFLYLINPLIIQQGMMLDIDNTVVTVASVLFLHEFVRLEKKGATLLLKYAWLTGLIALSFWAKEFAGIFLALSALVYVTLARKWKEVPCVLLMLIAGAGLFWGTWWIFAKLAGLPVMFFVRHTILGRVATGEAQFLAFVNELGFGQAMRQIALGFLNHIVWLSPFFAALAVAVAAWRLRRFRLLKRVEPVDLLFIYAMIILAVTQVYRPSVWFLKYTFPAVPILMFVVGAYLHEKLPAMAPWEFIAAGLLAVAVAASQVISIGDVTYSFFNFGEGGPERTLLSKNIVQFYALVLLALAILLKLIRRKWRIVAVFAGACAIGLAGANLGLDWSQRAPYVTSISWNNYGEKGFAEAVEHLRKVVPPGRLPICRKDIGFYFSLTPDRSLRRRYDSPLLTGPKNAAELAENITIPEVSHIVVEQYSLRKHTLPVMAQFYAQDTNIGNFLILKRIEPRQDSR